MNKWYICFVLNVILVTLSYGQMYPAWFLNQQRIKGESKTVGYSRLGYYIDSSYSAAKQNAVINYIRNKNCNIKGGQAFWATEAGKFIMSNRYEEVFDTLQYFNYVSSLKLIDSAIINDCVIVLMGENCEITKYDNERQKLSLYEEPEWINKMPSNDTYYYDIGYSEPYYYELSCWLQAEKTCRSSLARQIYSSIQAMQKLDDIEGQEIQNEDFSVYLSDIEVCARWKDPKKRIYYVLMRVPVVK
ncbi:MAG: hypothetical protein V1773_08380 [bacterium]